MKRILKSSLHVTLCTIMAVPMLLGCSGTDVDNENEQDLYSWSDIAGTYATKPEKISLGNYDWATYYQAYALKIEEHVLTDYGSIDNSDLVDGDIDTYCNGLKGDWYSDMLEWDIYGLDINGSSVDIYNAGEPTGYSIGIYKDYLTYKGRTYYSESYFNQHVDEWTMDTDSEDSTPSEEENITVSISSRTTDSNRFKRNYDITVKATGSNFTVEQIGLERVSGTFYPPTAVKTSAHQYTFSITYTSGSPSTIRGVVKTASGKSYKSNTITISK